MVMGMWNESMYGYEIDDIKGPALCYIRLVCLMRSTVNKGPGCVTSGLYG